MTVEDGAGAGAATVLVGAVVVGAVVFVIGAAAEFRRADGFWQAPQSPSGGGPICLGILVYDVGHPGCISVRADYVSPEDIVPKHGQLDCTVVR